MSVLKRVANNEWKAVPLICKDFSPSQMISNFQIGKKRLHVFYLLGSYSESFQRLENEESENEGATLTETGSGASK